MTDMSIFPATSFHSPRFENAANLKGLITPHRIVAISMCAILVIGALGLSQHLSTRAVGGCLAALGTIPFLVQIYLYVAKESIHTESSKEAVQCLAILSLIIGISGALKNQTASYDTGDKILSSCATAIGALGVTYLPRLLEERKP